MELWHSFCRSVPMKIGHGVVIPLNTLKHPLQTLSFDTLWQGNSL
jgi:hypothetical protein